MAEAVEEEKKLIANQREIQSTGSEKDMVWSINIIFRLLRSCFRLKSFRHNSIHIRLPQRMFTGKSIYFIKIDRRKEKKLPPSIKFRDIKWLVEITLVKIHKINMSILTETQTIQVSSENYNL